MNINKFIPPYPLKTAVLFLIFNRLDTTKQVFEAIRQAKPPKLYVAADGPRGNKEGEAEKVKAVREYVMNNIDWNCEVKTLFRDRNLGCKFAVSSAITWFFKNEEMGIILEDDCIPSQSFFWFCEKLLERYKDDNRIMMICGSNFIKKDLSYLEEDYFFSNYYPVWGWATWRRAWKTYDVNISYWHIFKENKQLNWLCDIRVAEYYENMFNLIVKGLDTWDFQWCFNCLFNNGLSIIPKKNTIKNIGLEGTHSATHGDNCIGLDTNEFQCEKLIPPSYITPDIILNKYLFSDSHANIDFSKNIHLVRLKKILIKKIPAFLKPFLRFIFRKNK